jgi:hypothetical protein
MGANVNGMGVNVSGMGVNVNENLMGVNVNGMKGMGEAGMVVYRTDADAKRET